MSHFSVLVITDEEPTREVLSKTLQPWHEYECTGIDDEYVVDVDVTEELMEKWNGEKSVVRLSDGSVISRYDDRCYVATDKKDVLGRPEKEFRLPDGATEETMPQREFSAATGESLQDFAMDWGGWSMKDDGRFYDRTNPNKKWDWWSVGGRYSNRLRVNGEKSDQARVADLELSAMKRANQGEREQWIGRCCSEAGITREELEIACREDGPAHDDWMALPEPKPRGEAYREWLTEQGGDRAILAKARRCWDIPNTGGKSFAEWIDGTSALSTFAVVKDGQWFERGNMGWWGVVFDEKDPDEWDRELDRLVGNLGPDQYVTFVDCHI